MIRTLNSLRFILILMIVISHSTLPISQDLINYLGEFPVAIFFVISGFVLSLSKGEKLQKEVLGNRIFSFPVSSNSILFIFWFSPFLGVVLLFIAMYFLSIHCNPNIRCAIIYWIPSAITVFYFTARDQGKGYFIRIFHNKLLLWLGSISFEIFLCHNLCFRIIQSIFLKRYGEGNPHQEFQFILSLAFIILTAWIAKKAIVLPIQHQLQKYL